MENIAEWAGKIDKNVRNKPNKQLQEELFKRVVTALQENTTNTKNAWLPFVVLMRKLNRHSMRIKTAQ